MDTCSWVFIIVFGTAFIATVSWSIYDYFKSKYTKPNTEDE